MKPRRSPARPRSRARDWITPFRSRSQTHDVVGDLDAIVLAALAPDAKRRYRSVDALTADLTAYLNDEPVARGAARAYRLGKPGVIGCLRVSVGRALR